MSISRIANIIGIPLNIITFLKVIMPYLKQYVNDLKRKKSPSLSILRDFFNNGTNNLEDTLEIAEECLLLSTDYINSPNSDSSEYEWICNTLNFLGFSNLFEQLYFIECCKHIPFLDVIKDNIILPYYNNSKYNWTIRIPSYKQSKSLEKAIGIKKEYIIFLGINTNTYILNSEQLILKEEISFLKPQNREIQSFNYNDYYLDNEILLKECYTHLKSVLNLFPFYKNNHKGFYQCIYEDNDY